MRVWPQFQLSDLCEINPPAPEPPSRSATVSFVPMSFVDEKKGLLDPSKIVPASEVSKGYTGFREDDVLFAKITPCMENGKAAIARGLAGGIGFGSTEFHVLRAGPLLLPDYLFLYVRQEEFRRRAKLNFVGSGGHMRVPESFFAQCSLPLPPLSEQRRIVEILREAEAVRRHQAQAARTAAELIPALFQQMFGGATGQRKHPLEKMAAVVSGVAKGRGINTSAVREVPYLRVANVQDGHLALEEMKTITATEDEIVELGLRPDDVVMTEGGDADKLGRGAMWRGEIKECIHQNHVFRVRPQKDILDGVWFSWFLRTDSAREYFLRAAKRTTNLASINMTQLKALPVPVIPYEVQRQFRTLAEEIEHTPSFNDSSPKIAELHASLLTHAFDGSLTARWREQNAALLATEAAARDAALTAKGIKPSTVGAAARPTDEDQAAIWTTPTDGAWTDLTQRQRALWPFIPPRGAFGVADLLHARDKDQLLASLSEDGFRRDLEVFVARGALVHVSRQKMNVEDEREVFQHYYRKVPLPDGEISWNAPAVKALTEQLRARLTSS